MNRFGELLAQATPAPGGAPQPPFGQYGQFVLMGLLFVVFYFVLIRPQQLRAKQQKKMLEALKSGDKVMTSAGIMGVVITVKERSITVRSGDSKLEFSKSAITEVLDPATNTEA